MIDDIWVLLGELGSGNMDLNNGFAVKVKNPRSRSVMLFLILNESVPGGWYTTGTIKKRTTITN